MSKPEYEIQINSAHTVNELINYLKHKYVNTCMQITSSFKKRHHKMQNIIRNHIGQIHIHKIYKIISKVRVDKKVRVDLRYEFTSVRVDQLKSTI